MISQIIEARPEDLRVWRRPPASPSTRSGARRPRPGSATPARTWTGSTTCARKSTSSSSTCAAKGPPNTEQYQALAAERKVKDAEWKALQFRALDVQLQGLREKLAQEETKLEQIVAGQREAEREIETGRVRREEAAETLNKAQAEVSGRRRAGPDRTADPAPARDGQPPE